MDYSYMIVLILQFLLLYSSLHIVESALIDYWSDNVILMHDDSKTFNFSAANDLCAQYFGTELASITSAEIQTEAETLIESSLGTPVLTNIWIGLNDQTTEGVWQWLDGQSFSYSYWSDSDPTGGTDKNCVYLLNNLTWSDEPCSSDYFINGLLCNTPPPAEHYTIDANLIMVYHSNVSYTWNDANDYCIDTFNSTLATIYTEHVNQEAVSLMTAHSLTHIDFWIGLNDINSEGSFWWEDGTPLVYTHWTDGNPDDGVSFGVSQDCTVMWRHAATLGQWDDHTCDSTNDGWFCNNNNPHFIGDYVIVVLPEEALNWNDANDYCQDKFGTTLATLHSALYEAEVCSLLENNRENPPIFSWLGYSDTAVQDQWVWADGSDTSYTDWNEGQPDNYGGNEHCTHLHCNYSTTGVHWNDQQCDWTGVPSFICNKPINVTDTEIDCVDGKSVATVSVPIDVELSDMNATLFRLILSDRVQIATDIHQTIDTAIHNCSLPTILSNLEYSELEAEDQNTTLEMELNYTVTLCVNSGKVKKEVRLFTKSVGDCMEEAKESLVTYFDVKYEGRQLEVSLTVTEEEKESESMMDRIFQPPILYIVVGTMLIMVCLLLVCIFCIYRSHKRLKHVQNEIFDYNDSNVQPGMHSRDEMR